MYSRAKYPEKSILFEYFPFSGSPRFKVLFFPCFSVSPCWQDDAKILIRLKKSKVRDSVVIVNKLRCPNVKGRQRPI